MTAEPGSRPFFVFTRNARNELELESYTWIDGADQISYVVRPHRVDSYWMTKKSDEAGARVILMASYGR